MEYLYVKWLLTRSVQCCNSVENVVHTTARLYLCTVRSSALIIHHSSSISEVKFFKPKLRKSTKSSDFRKTELTKVNRKYAQRQSSSPRWATDSVVRLGFVESSCKVDSKAKYVIEKNR